MKPEDSSDSTWRLALDSSVILRRSLSSCHSRMFSSAMSFDSLWYAMSSSRGASSSKVLALMTAVRTLSMVSLDKVIVSLEDLFLAGAASALCATGTAGGLLHLGRSLMGLLPIALLFLAGALAGLFPLMVAPCWGVLAGAPLLIALDGALARLFPSILTLC